MSKKIPDLGQQQVTEVIDLDDESEHSDFTLPEETDTIGQFSTVSIDLTGPNENIHLKHLPSYKYKDFVLRVDDTVELEDGDFLLIKDIPQRLVIHDPVLEGHLFRRAWKLEGLVERKTNEVVWMQQYNPNKGGDIYRQSLHRVSLRQIVVLREMILTNHTFPTGSYRDGVASKDLDKSIVLQTCRLACRWKYLAQGKNEGCLMTLNRSEVDLGYQTSESILKQSWRSTTIGGSCEEWLAGEKQFDKAERMRCKDLDPFSLRRSEDPLDGPGKRYTFGDSFCGAGGVSRGAKAAGLRVQWAFDFNKAAIDSYRLNFFETMCWCCPADTFITAIPDDVNIDVLHLSFPCQPFSPAHVRPGQNDEANEAAIFSLSGILQKSKPRVVMVEETFGLLRTEDRKQWFRALVQSFTKYGFSVRWKIFNFLDYGLPGRRQRLMVYASCPGEPLPEFPLPTHCSPIEHTKKRHLAPYRTINETIDTIPKDHSIHNDSKPCYEPTYDGNIWLPNTICCGRTTSKHPSSRLIHPSGKRTLTSRELATLNGMPLEHEFGKFGKTELRKQIGNAVPSIVAKIFFEQIIKSLRRADGL